MINKTERKKGILKWFDYETGNKTQKECYKENIICEEWEVLEIIIGKLVQFGFLFIFVFTGSGGSSLLF